MIERYNFRKKNVISSFDMYVLSAFCNLNIVTTDDQSQYEKCLKKLFLDKKSLQISTRFKSLKRKKYHPKNFQCPTSTFTHQHHHLLAKRALNLVHKSVLKSYFFATLKIQSLNPFSYNYVMDRRSSVIAEMKVPHKCGYEKFNVYLDG